VALFFYLNEVFMSVQQLEADVVIIGAGPVGLFAIFECGMNKLSCHVFDALDRVGGQCAALYPEKPIYDIPAHPSIDGADLVEQLKKQAEPFNPQYHLSQQVTHIESLSDEGKSWLVSGSNGTKVKCQSIIISAGVGAFGPNRPPLENIETFENTSVHYYINQKSSYAGKRLVIAGGGDSAVDWALNLVDIAAKIYVVHRRPKFRCAPDSEEKLQHLAKNDRLELVVPYQLSALKGDNGHLTGVEVSTLEGEKRMLDADILMPFFGLSTNLGPIAEWGLGLDRHHIMIDPLLATTNKPGIYAIGDIATYNHKQKLILTGFAEAAQAAHAIRTFLRPDEVVHFEYSTTKGVPGA
jgi:thioredoxin reductase (NADPH)